MTQSACHDAHVPEPTDSEREVLTSLPRSRPVRRSTKRPDRPATETVAAKPPPPRDAPRRKVPAAGYAAPDGRAGEPTASAGAELINTTIQAAVELAQIGLAVGRQTLQSLLDRLPKP
jgi:hypothetical protein